MKAYRLEMGTKFGVGEANTLSVLGESITKAINKSLAEQGDDVLINLASNEYYKAVKPKLLEGRIITPIFGDLKGDQYKVVMTWAKKMRGTMSNYIIKHQINDPE